MVSYEEAKELYEDGISMREIERRTGYPRKKLSRQLKKDNVFQEYHDGSTYHFKCTYEEPIHYEIVDLYLSGMSMDKIAEKYGFSTSKINRIIHYHEVLTKRVYRKYKLDESVFESIDNELSAYWLGFLYADGYVRNDLSAIELGLQSADKDHIIRFKHFLKTNAPIVDKTVVHNGCEYSVSKITICGAKVVNDLIDLGCTNNKSLSLAFPDFIEKPYLHHFMRGYFDGDGSISLSKRKDTHTPVFRVSIVGTKGFLAKFHNHLQLDEKYKDVENRFLGKAGKAYDLSYTGNSIVSEIGNFLYKDSNIFLPRKYDKFADLL